MSERSRNAVYTVLILGLMAAVVSLVLSSPTQDDRVERLGNSIKCPVCQGESIADSPSDMARDMMTLVAERVEQGLSDDDIVNELLASYSGAVLLDPPVHGPALVLWAAPVMAIFLGVGVILWWRRHPGETLPADGAKANTRRRFLVGGLVLSVAFAGIVVAAGFFVQDRTGIGSGAADVDVSNLEEVSNETMEAVIAANRDNPEINGMRLTLAERYYLAGDYRSAFPHYLAVAESARASDTEAVTALIRLGWMAWVGNGEVAPAIGMFDQALSIDSTSATARYLKGQVLWCGANRSDEAALLFQEVLDSGNLPEESLAAVETDLRAVTNGDDCS